MSGIGNRPSKGTGPFLPEVLHRERLFAHLDESRKRPVVWIAAPAGAGKTTLVATYLQARSLPALWYRLDGRDGDCAAFFQGITRAAGTAGTPSPGGSHREIDRGGRAFFEQFFAAAIVRGIVVLEDYHHIPLDSPFHRLLAEGMDALPPGVNLLITGRTLPPPPFSRHIISRRVALLSPEELAFTPEEARGIAQLLGRAPVPGRLEEILRQTGGWGAGLTLGLLNPSVSDRPGELMEAERAEIFDYFAEEVFSKIEPGVRDFLLRVSFLPRVSASSAQRLTSTAAAGEILSLLHHRCCFVERSPGPGADYRFNPLFRVFLQSRAERILTEKELARLWEESARALRESGEVEEAAHLYLKMGDWGELIALVEEEAEHLIAAGRSDALRRWLELVPRELRAAHPRLPFWLGRTLLAAGAEGGFEFFRQAFNGGKQTGDLTLTLLAWSGAVDALLLGRGLAKALDPWTEWLLDWHRQGGRFPSPGVEARAACSLSGALTLRDPGHPSLRGWLERALSLTEWGDEPSLRLHVLRTAALYYLWMGKAAECTMATEALRDLSSPLSSESWLEVITCFWAEGGVEEGFQILERLRCANREAPLSDMPSAALGVWGHLLEGNLEKAGAFLGELKGSLYPGRPQGHCRYHYFAAWYFLRARKPSRARLHALAAVRLGIEAGAVLPALLARLALAQILLASGEADSASEQLESAASEIDRYGSRILCFMHLLASARLALDRQNGGEGDLLLRRALHLGAREGYSYLLAWWEPEVMARLCVRALEEGIETAYVQDPLRRCRLTPDPPPLHLSCWPWPMRVYTLGRFNLLIEGVPVRFSGKIQQKPLDLLKALVALGGRNVAAQQICDLLWPDADGDAAQASFSTTLHRLRKLVRHEGAIRLSDSKLSLDPRLCWVDTWAFQRKASEAEEEAPESTRTLEEAIDLYSGNFLAADSYPWAVPLRERLRGRFLRLVRHRGDLLTKAGDVDGALRCFTRGLDADPLSEDLYQNIIRCCRQIGRHGEAASVFRRCCDALAGAGLKPSARTLQLLELSSDQPPE